MKGNVKDSTALMAPRKKRQHERDAAIAQAILEQYQPQTKEDMQEAIKGYLWSVFETMLRGEMDSHLGYERTITVARIRITAKWIHIQNVKTAYGEIPVDVPRDQQATF